MSYHSRWVESSFFQPFSRRLFPRLCKIVALYLKNLLSFIQTSSDVWILKKTTEQHNVMALDLWTHQRRRLSALFEDLQNVKTEKQ